MKKNYAFIDSQNLHMGTQVSGWKLDFLKFRNYLKTKYASKYKDIVSKLELKG